MVALALFGGPAIVKDPSSLINRAAWPIITRQDVKHIIKTIRGRDFWSFCSPTVAAFEEAYAQYVNTKYAVACSSGTVALQMALSCAGIGPGDEVLVPSLTFIASASAIVAVGATPVFVDVDSKEFNLCTKKLETKLTSKTRAIMAVNLHGLPADYDALRDLCRTHGILLVEDNSQAHGARFGDTRTGALGDVAAASIMPGKNLPGLGEGGVVTTNSKEMFERARRIRNLGAFDDSVPVDNALVGSNYHITPTVAAVAHSQLSRLDSYNRSRQGNALKISTYLGSSDIFVPPFVPNGREHVFTQYRVLLKPTKAFGTKGPRAFRNLIAHALKAEGLSVNPYQRVALTKFPVFAERASISDDCDICTNKVIDSSFVLHPYLLAPGASEENIAIVSSCLQKVEDNLDELMSRGETFTQTAPWKEGLYLY